MIKAEAGSCSVGATLAVALEKEKSQALLDSKAEAGSCSVGATLAVALEEETTRVNKNECIPIGYSRRSG